jgi:hypothetical protein
MEVQKSGKPARAWRSIPRAGKGVRYINARIRAVCACAPQAAAPPAGEEMSMMAPVGALENRRLSDMADENRLACIFGHVEGQNPAARMAASDTKPDRQCHRHQQKLELLHLDTQHLDAICNLARRHAEQPCRLGLHPAGLLQRG